MCHLRRFALILPFALAMTLPAIGQDAVVFPDGFVLRGKYGKEVGGPMVLDSPIELSIPCDYLNTGTKWLYFSNNAKKGIQLVKGAKEEKEKEVEYKRPAVQGPAPMPKVVGEPTISIGEYNADGRRRITIKSQGYPEERIVQVASQITPRFVFLNSITHSFRQVYATSELGPVAVRALLANHPDLRDGWLPVPDPMKRVKIAEFLLACGWRAEAKAELDKTKKELPWAWPKEAADKFDQVSAAIDKEEVSWVLNELEVAVAAGQYKLAGQVLKTYQPKAADKAALERLTKLKATLETLQPKFEATRAHLRALIDEVTGADRHKAIASVSGAVVAGVPGKAVPVEWKGLIPGAEAVYAELHQDSLDRIETFAQVADQMARERAGGRPSKSKPEQALARAVTGWLMGKNGANNDPVSASKVWNTRAMVTAYLNERAINARAAVLRKYNQSTDVLGPDEIAQIVSLLPPIDAENLTKRRGKPVDPKQSGAPDVFKMESGALPDDLEGVAYYVRLPREYHHGRSYPLVVAIQDPAVPAAAMIGYLAAECDRHGYILVSPEWAMAFGDKSFDYTGKDHRVITSTIRDASRKFNVDQDRVFAFGYGQGGTFALDLAMSRPDQFAGVATMGAAPVQQFYREYAKNAQKLAVYSVTGELAPGTDGLRKVYQNWLPYGFYSILSVYKGRGPEWYAAEVPTVFDWMNRKKRVRGLDSLRMDGNRFDAWHTFREGDNRFYWVGVSDLMPGNTLTAKKAERPDNPPIAASFSADIINGKTVVVKTNRGVKKVTVWLERGMVDWGKKVEFSIDSGVEKLKPIEVKPDLELMLEELYRTGDRKMLFFAKFEFRIN